METFEPKKWAAGIAGADEAPKPEINNVDAVVLRLTELSPMEYDQQRENEAEPRFGATGAKL